MEPANATAWPFAIGTDASERIQWGTDVLEPTYGPPQCLRLLELPRVALTFSGLESGRARRYLEAQLHGNGGGLWHAPLVTDRTYTDAQALLGATTVPVTTTGLRFVEGGNAILLGPEAETFEVVEIDTLAAGAITLTAPLARTWAAGSTIIPTVGARLASFPQLARFTGDAAPYGVTFMVDDAMTWPADFGAASYRGFPVFEFDGVDWSNDPTYEPDRRLVELDSGTGLVHRFDLADVPRPLIRFSLGLVTRASVAAFRSLVYALAGRWSPLWVPSFGQDFHLVAAGASTIDVDWTGYSAWPINAGRRDLRIQPLGAAPVYRRITAAVALDADTERLTLDSPLPGGFTAAGAWASFMALSLQDSDVNLLRAWANEDAASGPAVVLSELTFRGFPHDY